MPTNPALAFRKIPGTILAAPANRAKRGAYGVTVRPDGGVKITGNGSPAANGSTLHSQALTAASANGAPVTV